LKLLLITPYYLPDLGPSTPLFSLLCEEIVKDGNDLNVVTTLPHYPSGIVNDDYKNKIKVIKEINGVKVHYLWIPSGNRSNLVHRLFAFLIFQITSAFYILSLNFNVAIITNPFFETFIPFWVVCKIKRRPILHCVWDVYPEIGMRLNLFKNPFIIKIITILEDYCLNHSSKIHVLSKETANQLIHNHYINQKKIFIQPPWVDLNWLKPKSVKKTINNDNFNSKFIVLYAGNMGLSQELFTILDVAKSLQHDTNVVFIFIGDGVNKKNLIDKAYKENITNVYFYPFAPKENLPNIYGIADICLISLHHEIIQESLPSKTFSIMACGKPILAFVGIDSSVWRLVNETNSGITVPSNKIFLLETKLREIINQKNQLTVLGVNARKFSEKNFSHSIAAKNFIKQLNKLSKVEE
jgi:colanic acid biosynthesis glycosyl transferase WcaI